MPNHSSGFNPSDYATVAQRVVAFRAAYPFGSIRTRLHSRVDGEITFVAEIFRRPEDTAPAATGWASERVGDGEINIAWCLENAETSAVGRALANLGFSASRQAASMDEMLAAGRRSNGSLRLVREPSAHEASPPRRDADAALQAAADALADALGQLQQAERLGMLPRAAARIRRMLEGRSVPPSAIARAEQELRAWFESHVPMPRFDLPAEPLRGDEPPPDGGV